MNIIAENKNNNPVQDMEKDKEFVSDIKPDKGDIDDYIFSWQTAKYVSER